MLQNAASKMKGNGQNSNDVDDLVQKDEGLSAYLKEKSPSSII